MGCLQRITSDGRAGCMQFLRCYPRICPTVNTVWDKGINPVRLVLLANRSGSKLPRPYRSRGHCWHRMGRANPGHVDLAWEWTPGMRTCREILRLLDTGKLIAAELAR